MRNRQLIVHWLIANTPAIDVRRRDGKTYYVMADAEAFREGVGPAAGRGAAHQVDGRLRRRARAGRDLRRALRPAASRRGGRARRCARPAVVHRLRHAAPRAGPRRCGRDRRRRHLVPDGLRGADAGVFGKDNGLPAQAAGTRPALENQARTTTGIHGRLTAPGIVAGSRAEGFLSDAHHGSRCRRRHGGLSRLRCRWRAGPFRSARRHPPRHHPGRGGAGRHADQLQRLTTAATTPSPLQAMAVRAVGRLERLDQVSTLLPLLDAKEPRVRAEAANALAQSAGVDPAAAQTAREGSDGAPRRGARRRREGSDCRVSRPAAGRLAGRRGRDGEGAVRHRDALPARVARRQARCRRAHRRPHGDLGQGGRGADAGAARRPARPRVVRAGARPREAEPAARHDLRAEDAGPGAAAGAGHERAALSGMPRACGAWRSCACCRRTPRTSRPPPARRAIRTRRSAGWR